MLSRTCLSLVGATLAVTAAVSTPASAQFLIGSGSGCPPGVVTVPPDWYSGDTHDHIQLCGGAVITANDILMRMQSTSLDVSNALIWGLGVLTQAEFDAFMMNVTGQEDLASVGQPEVIQFGVEVSLFEAAKLGHFIGLNVTPAETAFFNLGLGCPGLMDQSGDYGAPILDMFRQAPEAVTGYSHTFWPVETYVPAANGGFNWEDPSLPSYVGFDARCSFGQDMAFPTSPHVTVIYPVLAAIDVAMRRIDFIESVELEFELNPTTVAERWFGMVYKLWSAGMRVSISAGSDANCVQQVCPPRTYVMIDPGTTLDYDQWTKNLAAGRVSLATGTNQFLDLRVNGMPPGDQIDLSGPGAQVSVTATYHHAGTPAVTDAIEIVLDGSVVHSQSFGPLTDGTHTFQVSVPVSRSGWIAARTQSQSTHTAPVHLIHDGKPVANCAEAEYWALHCDYTRWLLDVGFLQSLVGCSEPEIRSYIAAGREVFAALRDYDSALPTQVTRYGTSAPPDCTQPIGIVTSDAPVVGDVMTFRCFNAPSNAQGWLVVGGVQDVAGTPFNGAVLHIAPNPGTLFLLDATSNEAGYAAVSLDPLPPAAGFTAYAQYVWANPVGCASTGLFSSSDALAFTLIP